MKSSGKKLSLPAYDDIFSTEESRVDDAREKVVQIPLSELHPFAEHPFRVLDDKKMQETVDSIAENGVLVPAIARPRPEGGYELISGHRRKHGCELLGLETMPVIVRDLTDDQAILMMVDSNIQRETLLPSERAFAYEYQPGRGAKHPTAFLEGFRGYLHTDGYAGYYKLPEDITVVGCWAHARRKFDEALKSIAKGHASAKNIRKGLDFCNRLFAIEQQLADLPAEEQYKQRLEQAKPVLDELFRWVESVHYSPKSPWGSAMEYLKNQKSYLLNYLLDGRLEISNNRAERSIKPFVIDRKNFLFANTPGGAQGSAVIFSLIQTAIENGLDSWRYLSWVIDMAVKGDEDAEGLLPWAAPDSCRILV